MTEVVRSCVTLDEIYPIVAPKGWKVGGVRSRKWRIAASCDEELLYGPECPFYNITWRYSVFPNS
jgi:hypothetical protein